MWEEKKKETKIEAIEGKRRNNDKKKKEKKRKRGKKEKKKENRKRREKKREKRKKDALSKERIKQTLPSYAVNHILIDGPFGGRIKFIQRILEKHTRWSYFLGHMAMRTTTALVLSYRSLRIVTLVVGI